MKGRDDVSDAVNSNRLPSNRCLIYTICTPDILLTEHFVSRGGYLSRVESSDKLVLYSYESVLCDIRYCSVKTLPDMLIALAVLLNV